MNCTVSLQSCCRCHISKNIKFLITGQQIQLLPVALSPSIWREIDLCNYSVTFISRIAIIHQITTINCGKLERFLKNWMKSFQHFFHSFQKLVIDCYYSKVNYCYYSKVGCTSNSSFHQRHRFGIKIFALCDCETGMVLKMSVYIRSFEHCNKKTYGEPFAKRYKCDF